MTTAADALRREEQRLLLAQIERGFTVALVGCLLVAIGFFGGLHVGRSGPSAQDDALQLLLHQSADSLRSVRHVNDSLRAVDSVVSLAAAEHRERVDRAARQVHVSTIPGDSVVIVERPAAVDSVTHDTTFVPDTTVSLPIASFIREAKLQLALDTAALHVKDLRIASLERADSLSIRRDSIQVERAAGLEHERDSAFRRGLKTGLRWGAALGAVAVVVVKVIAG